MSSVPEPLTVAIDAALDVVSGSGAERGIASLIDALDHLDGDERYLVVTSPLEPEWLAAQTGRRARMVVAPHSFADPSSVTRLRFRARLRRLVGPLLPLVRRLRRGASTAAPAVARSDPFFASLGAHVVHFSFQQYMRTGLPSIFEPLDLQHRHFPHFLSGSEIAWREATYTTACKEAEAVVAPSHWQRKDLIAELGLPPEKVYAIYRPVTTSLAEAPSESQVRTVRERFGLPDAFLYYPAITWAHKNHLRLVEALAAARRGAPVVVVCSGTRTEHFGAIQRRVSALGLEGAFRHLGRVSAVDVRALYRSARGLILPSLSEGASLLIMEAFAEGCPVASSDATALPEMAADGALLFDATSVDAIADAMVRLWTDERLRLRIVESGRRRLRDFDPVVTARTYRALYRSLAGRTLSADDAGLLRAARP